MFLRLCFVNLQVAGGPRISPDGRTVAYTLRTTDWQENRYDTEIWLARENAAPFQLTRTEKGSSIAPRWSPDGRRIAFLADRGDKQQIYLIDLSGGEARRLTTVKEGVNAFEWAPDGALTKTARGAMAPRISGKSNGIFAGSLLYTEATRGM